MFSDPDKDESTLTNKEQDEYFVSITLIHTDQFDTDQY